IGSAGPDREAGGRQRASLLDRAVAVDAGNLDRIARLAIQLSVAVRIAVEMAVDPVHPTLEVNVLEMDRHAWTGALLGIRDRIGELVCRCRRHHVPDIVEEPPLTIALEHGAEHPSVAVKICELCPLQ